MKPGDLILVTGMAHTGTTVVAAILGTHPSVRLFVGGGQYFVLENDIIRPETRISSWPRRIAEIRAEAREEGRIALLKNTWLATEGPSFWEQLSPEVVVIPMWMDWMAVRRQWEKHVISANSIRYDRNYEAAMTLGFRGVSNVVHIRQESDVGPQGGLYSKVGLAPAPIDETAINFRWGLGWVDTPRDQWISENSKRAEMEAVK